MARKRSKSLDGFPLPIPPEPKTIKLTVLQKCFICQKELRLISEVEAKWYEESKNCFEKAPDTDKICSLMRVKPTSLRDAMEHAEVQKIPGWSGFNDILYLEMPQESNIGYCPMIDGASNEFSTVYTVLKHAQMLSSALGQGDAVITFDLLIYMKAKQIQWR